MEIRFSIMNRLVVCTLALVLGFGLAACETEPAEPMVEEEPEDTVAAQNTLVDVAMDNDQFSTFVTAFQEAGLAATLQGEGPFTVFAPTNAAFEALPKGRLEELMRPENQEQLLALLTYHVHQGDAVGAEAISDMEELSTMSGQALPVQVEGGDVMVGDATVTLADLEASNGVIHAIDMVLMPDDM